MATDFYVTIGVEQDASQKQIDLMYAVRMRELQGAAPRTNLAMLDLQQAHSVLGHPSSRERYDNSINPRGSEKSPVINVGGKLAIGSGAAADESARIAPVSLTSSFDTVHPSFDELFDRLWSNFSHVTRPKAETIRNLTIDIPISPEQAMTGGTAEVMIPAFVECENCRGTGGVGPFHCLRCDGHGAIAAEYPVNVSFPPGYASYTAQVPLTQLGIHNFYLTVNFCLTSVRCP